MSCRSLSGNICTQALMSDLNVTVAPTPSLDKTKESLALPAQGHAKAAEPLRQVKTEPDKKPKPLTATDLNYSINHEDKALHLKVKGADGAVVRELVFDRIDPNLLDAKKLKGICVDGNS